LERHSLQQAQTGQHHAALLFGGGRGKVIYLILEEQRRVDVLKVMCLD
jgi:hypothetical protein